MSGASLYSGRLSPTIFSPPFFFSIPQLIFLNLSGCPPARIGSCSMFCPTRFGWIVCAACASLSDLIGVRLDYACWPLKLGGSGYDHVHVQMTLDSSRCFHWYRSSHLLLLIFNLHWMSAHTSSNFLLLLVACILPWILPDLRGLLPWNIP
jgi:hypothetical protein